MTKSVQIERLGAGRLEGFCMVLRALHALGIGAARYGFFKTHTWDPAAWPFARRGGRSEAEPRKARPPGAEHKGETPKKKV